MYYIENWLDNKKNRNKRKKEVAILITTGCQGETEGSMYLHYP